jgi:hypothetical protein
LGYLRENEDRQMWSTGEHHLTIFALSVSCGGAVFEVRACCTRVAICNASGGEITKSALVWLVTYTYTSSEKDSILDKNRIKIVQNEV